MGTLEFKAHRNDFILEVMRQGISVYLEDMPFAQSSLEVMVHDSYERMGKELRAMHNLPVEPLTEVVNKATFRTPKTWWQFFKAEHFPVWLLSRYPVQWHKEEQEVRTKVGAVYPQFPEIYPKNLGTIRYSYTKIDPISSYPIAREGEPLDD